MTAAWWLRNSLKPNTVSSTARAAAMPPEASGLRWLLAVIIQGTACCRPGASPRPVGLLRLRRLGVLARLSYCLLTTGSVPPSEDLLRVQGGFMPRSEEHTSELQSR